MQANRMRAVTVRTHENPQAVQHSPTTSVLRMSSGRMMRTWPKREVLVLARDALKVKKLTQLPNPFFDANAVTATASTMGPEVAKAYD